MSAPATPRRIRDARLHVCGNPECGHFAGNHGEDGQCIVDPCACKQFVIAEPAAPPTETGEPERLLTDEEIGACHDAANEAVGPLFYRWNDPKAVWQKGIGRAYKLDFARRIEAAVIARLAARTPPERGP